MPAFLHHKPPVISRLACSFLLLSIILSAVTPLHPYPSTDSRTRLLRRQLPNQTGSTPFPAGLLDPTGNNRSLDPTKTSPSTPTSPSPADPAAPPSSPSPAPSPQPNPPKDPTSSNNNNNQPKDPSLSDPLLPGLLGSPPLSPASPAASSTPSPPPNNSTRPLTPSSPAPNQPTSNSTSPLSPAPAASAAPAPTSKGQSPTSSDPAAAAAASPSPSAQPDPNRTPKTPPHKSDDSSSGFGSTTIKLMAIIAGCVAGLFLLWTIIRKWKFRPSKRFAKKLDEYDEDVFAPRPPSFGEKRANDYQAYSIPTAPNPGPVLNSHYPSYLPERSGTPHSAMSPQKAPYGNDLHGSQPYQAHRISHASITQPPAMFEPNPYRLSLGLGNITHAYPPSDQHKPTVM
ncbi:hypothetical protein PGT21_001098 [Puccinia graminis f. sp. tritici]|uniref:Mid2 domain-containing protein n=1 Tax=Puccinia graminis f. sp. tritici TaxID=56615 RepID=A0A5B0NP74_PUCGR|nr:hypothetical protein PGT21_001098 [Puccinia graminis f. sp. tritici]KAA1127827.1 hypothetical protein PGTUg99_009088 [Puccinia graminis f. sp. tritici]